MKLTITPKLKKILKALGLTLAVLIGIVLFVAFMGYMWDNHRQVLLITVMVTVLSGVGIAIFFDIYTGMN